MIYAYIRVSSADQNPARQEQAINDSSFQISEQFIEIASGKDINRPKLQQLLTQLVAGDTLVVHSIDRLCRNMMDMCNITTQLRQQGTSLVFLKENIHFCAAESNPLQELQLHMMSAFSSLNAP
ncbi:recombinase family protein [Photobacterium frigidiphilum]|uniref:recombinase family protein n=1 Tax=Photobacterium frigidiphilum TaxID=264736 RepID=UPI001D13191D|nr:recombinase family protein [Photobacterium frigidiphilum]